jgi:acyl dehydratase
MTGFYLEDFAVDQVIETAARTVGDGLVDSYAGVTGDFSYVHIDAERAAAGIFGERVAHGLLSLSLLQGLLWQTGYLADTGLATIGWDKVRFPAPLRFGDTVRGRIVITEARPSRSRPETGIVVESCTLLNQDDEVVLTAEHASLVRRRPVGD